MELIGKLTIMFASTGAIAGCISGFLTSADIKLNTLALFIALILFYASYKLTPSILKIPAGEFPGGKKKIVMTGFWPHFIMWLIFWIIVYTLLMLSK